MDWPLKRKYRVGKNSKKQKATSGNSGKSHTKIAQKQGPPRAVVLVISGLNGKRKWRDVA